MVNENENNKDVVKYGENETGNILSEMAELNSDKYSN